MKERFNNKRLLTAALQSQKVCGGLEEIAIDLADRVELKELAPGDILITQGKADTDIYFILVGTFTILVNGRKVNTRSVNDHVGEMSAVDPSLPRSATVVADTPSVVAKISEETLTGMATKFGIIWRNLARELAKRLHQRNNLITAPNDRPKLFIMSSKEALPIAQEVQAILDHDMSVQVWTDGVFFASSYALEALERAVENVDFAVAIAQGDDVLISRKRKSAAPRDNVIFELGMFMGHLGRARTILFQPEGKHLKLPSDLNGLTA